MIQDKAQVLGATSIIIETINAVITRALDDGTIIMNDQMKKIKEAAQLLKYALAAMSVKKNNTDTDLILLLGECT